MTTIYFVRHGDYVNPDKIVPWRLPNFSLSPKGMDDIKRDGEYFRDKDIKAIYSSPVLRAKQSADILGKILNLDVLISPNIEEVYTPLQEQRITYEELFKKKTIPYEEEFHKENNGENFDDIFKRVNELVNQVLDKHKDNNIIFVSHGDPIMIYYYKMIRKQFSFIDLLDGPEYIEKSGIIKFNFENNKFKFAEKVNLN